MAELVEGSGLENRQGRKPLEGSNPSLSAKTTKYRSDPNASDGVINATDASIVIRDLF